MHCVEVDLKRIRSNYRLFICESCFVPELRSSLYILVSATLFDRPLSVCLSVSTCAFRSDIYIPPPPHRLSFRTAAFRP